ncbi:MAG: beta-lactamase hydrolase domain-containing protein [Phycisphaerales bacterium]
MSTVLCIALLALPACASRSPGIGADVIVYESGLERIEYIDGVGAVDGMWRDGEVVIAGAPSALELQGLIQAFGIVRVVNLAPRGYVERMVDYDEAAIVASLGAEYIWLPMAPGQLQNPARADEVGEALVGAGGPILLHSAWLGDAAAHWWALAVRMGQMNPVGACEYYLQMVDGVQIFPIEGYTDSFLVPRRVSSGVHLTLAQSPPSPMVIPLAEAPVGALEEIPDTEGVRGFALDGRFAVGGQPDEAWLERQRDAGLSLVFNLRTADEMQRDVNYNERAACERLGLTYIHEPSGWGEDDYTTTPTDRFAEALERATGTVYLHCQVGWRATHMWAAYLHRHRDVPANEAMRRAMAGTGSWPFTPFERLAGLELEWDLIPR